MSLIVILCMAGSFVLSNQSYFVFMDRIEHSVGHEHLPNPLAGVVHHCEHAHDLCGDAEPPPDGALSHHHHDSTLVYLPATSPVVAPVLRPSSFRGMEPPVLGGLSVGGLERPPRTRASVKI